MKQGNHYVPELGQAAFGQPWQSLEISDMVLRALDAISCFFDIFCGGDNPFSNTGATYDGKHFKIRAYSWGDEYQPFNFAWRDVRISWYKYLGRGTTMNREMTLSEIKEMMRDCFEEFQEQKNDF